MKQFAKSLVSVVIALSILATMCIVGISVSAEATSGEFVLISDTATKDKSTLTATKDGGVAVGDVVDSSSLAQATGVPAKAFSVKISAIKDGIHIPVNGGSTNSSAIAEKPETDLVLDAWIYISDISKTSNPIIRFYGEGGNTAGGNGKVEGWFLQGGLKDTMALSTGWNHVQRKITWGNNGDATTLPSVITGFTLHDHAAPAGEYTLAVASMKIYWDDNLGKDPADGKTYLVSTVPFEGGIAVGTREDVTYEDGTAAYASGTGVVKFQKKLANTVDVTNKVIVANIYVEDATKLTSGELELTSSGTCDQGEFNFSVPKLGLKQGWNKVLLDLNHKEGDEDLREGVIGYTAQVPGTSNTTPDITKINYVRMHTGETVVKFGVMYLADMPAKPVTIDESEVADFAADEADGAYIPTQGTQSTVTLVDVSTLTGGKYEGDNTKAYKVTYNTGAARKAGAYTSLENPVRMNSNGAEADYTFEAWIWSEKDVSSYILQIYNNGYESNKTLIATGAASGNSNTTENWIYRFGADVSNAESNPGPVSRDIVLKAGWNHIKFTLDDIYDKTNNNDGLVQLGSGSNDHTKKAYSEFVTDKTVTGFSIHDNETPVTTIAIADVKLYKTSEVKEPEVDANKVGTTIISANLDKADSDISAANGGTGSVVKTADLKGGQSGVPSVDAYKAALNAKKVGIALPIENTDWSKAAAAKVDDAHALKDYGVNMWLWISDASKVSNLVLRFYEEGKRNGDVENWTYQWNSSFKISANLQTGWNNVTLWFPSNTTGDYDHRGSLQTDGSTITEFTIHDHGEAPNYEIAIACARLVTTTDDVTGGWLAGSATGDAVNLAVVVVAILFAAIAAATTVYFGKKAR